MEEALQLCFTVYCPVCSEIYTYKVFIDKEGGALRNNDESITSFYFDHGSHMLEVSLDGKGSVVEVKAVPWVQAPKGIAVWKRESPYFPVLSSSFDVLFIDRGRKVYCDLNWRDEVLSVLPLAEIGKTARYLLDGEEYWVLSKENNVVVVKRSKLWSDEVFSRLSTLIGEFKGKSVASDPAFQRIFIAVLEASADDPLIALDATRLVSDLGKTVSINVDLIMLSPVPFGGELTKLLSSVENETLTDFIVLAAGSIRELIKLLKNYRLLKNLNLIKVVE